jgi:hypothetical protein
VKDFQTVTEDSKVVASVPRRPGVQVGRPRRVVTSALRSKYASCGMGGSFGGGGGMLGGVGGGIGGTSTGSGGNFYSPEMSTDFLEIAQSLDELRQYFRFFYDNDAFVGQAIDVHTEIPLSKTRFGLPKAKDAELSHRAQRFCDKWEKRVRGGGAGGLPGLPARLMEIVHEYHTIGEVFVWVEDSSPDEPEDVRMETVRTVDAEGNTLEKKVERADADERSIKWLKKNYKGWSKIDILPPEQVQVETFPFSDEVLIQLVIDSKSKSIVEQAKTGDVDAKRIVEGMSPEIVDAILRGESKVTLNTDPEAGSFCAYLARKRSPYEKRGRSILQRCLRTLVYRDKLRQAQTSIASRNMTPTRVVWAEGLDVADIELLREQIDMSLMDPDYSIIANYQLNWEEMSSNGRLLDLNSEYDLTDRQLYAGLGVTEGLLSGETSFSGDRIHLEVINTRYMLLRETISTFVQEMLLRPMCARMGFIEEDEDGEEVVIYPTLSFTRLGLRDNDSTFDQLFNLYQKGSVDVYTIFELLNLDPQVVEERLMASVGKITDPMFNEVLRGMYSRIGDSLAEKSNAAEKIAVYLGYTYKIEEGAERF